MKENPPVKCGYYRVLLPYDEKGHLYEYTGGLYARDINRNIYTEIMLIYNTAQFMGEEYSFDVDS